MPNAYSRPWHRGSIFGDGPRRALDREQRARFRFLLNAHRRARRLTPLSEVIGNALVRRLGVDGQCDPSHDTIASDAGCCARTVRRALEAMRVLGLVVWQRRIVRDGWRVEQTSNAYLLAPVATPNPPAIRAPRTGGQTGRQTLQSVLPPASPADVAAAQAALAQRRAAIEGRLLTRGSGPTVRAI
jgi:hypothetical protein